MIELIGALGGFFTGVVPDLIGLWREKKDREHELTIMKLQMEQQAQGHNERLAEINVQADIAESKAIYATHNVGIPWVDAYNGTVRPTLAYGFFILYLMVKVMLYRQLDFTLPWSIEAFWTATDSAFVFGVMSYYFGQRAMAKVLRLN